MHSNSFILHFLSIYPSMHPSIHPPTYLLPTCLSVCLSVCLCIVYICEWIEIWNTGAGIINSTEGIKDRSSQCKFLHHKSYVGCPGMRFGLRGENPANNRRSYSRAEFLYSLPDSLFNKTEWGAGPCRSAFGRYQIPTWIGWQALRNYVCQSLVANVGMMF